MADLVFALGVKTYCTMSGRRATGYVRSAEARGLIDCAPSSFTSSFRYLESADLTPLLKGLIEESARPLAAVESNFAIDSTGFATTTYHRWYVHKWGKERAKASWVKTHVCTGVTTNVVTAAEAAATESADALQLPKLVAVTAENFAIQELSGDKAYSSRRNLRAVEAVGGSPYIPFKNRTNGYGKRYEGLWHRSWHYFMFDREAFLQHYHKRSNVESTVSMIKAKFGPGVRAKTPDAQVNEVLLKVVAHNICVLIQCVYELGLEPVFWAPVPKVEAIHTSVPKVGTLPLS